ncbi:MAG: hypothetical protein NTY19_27965 [Planctomycetota bacterium]|nr:hypothetical protein [Planctomycetota bacterium]
MNRHIAEPGMNALNEGNVIGVEVDDFAILDGHILVARVSGRTVSPFLHVLVSDS